MRIRQGKEELTMSSSSWMELSYEDRRRLALILQGTSAGPGININQLNFNKDLEKLDGEIERFIQMINKYFEGILQLIRSGNFIVPIITNQDAIEVKRRSISSKVIGLACIILLHEFVYKNGPTLTDLETKFQITKINTRELVQLISDLRKLHWVDEIEEAGVIYYVPSAVLKACISPEMLITVYSEIYIESKDEEEKELLIQFLPKEYMKIRDTLHIGSKQKGITKFLDIKGEKNGKCNTD